MPLIDQPDFQAYLSHRAAVDLPPQRDSDGAQACDLCGAKPDGGLVLLHGRCMICLAHEFGFDQAEAAATLMCKIRAELAKTPYLSPSILQAVITTKLE